MAWLLLWHMINPWPGNFHTWEGVRPKKKKRREILGYFKEQFMKRARNVLIMHFFNND